MSKLQDYEFFDTYVVGYHRDFDGVHGLGNTNTISFSPGILRIGSMVFEKHWKVTDLAEKEAIAAIPSEPEKTAKVSNGYFENANGEKEFKPKKDDIVYYIVKTKDMIGESIDIDLSDIPITFEFDGHVSQDGRIPALEVTSNRMRIELKVIKKKK